jgi:predicted membrane GTPase involved in stress response
MEVVSMERVVTTLPEDSFGVARLLPAYQVETALERVGAGRTRVEFRHSYSILGWKAWLFHWIAGRGIVRESQATLNAMKQAIENRASGVRLTGPRGVPGDEPDGLTSPTWPCLTSGAL